VTRLLLAAIVLAGACGSKEEPPPSPRPTPIAQAEQQRGTDACKAFVTRTCACAKAHPERADVAEKCSQATSLPEAMEMALDVDREPASQPEDVFRAQSEVRQVIATCMAGVNWLATSRCP
jgi:hypothetical protein